ncbi:MAG: PKD domain-containing protein [Deltaproteobacteria bacterium]|nr:PKD domain-containing protein [Deltaproteobacteria bacterium]
MKRALSLLFVGIFLAISFNFLHIATVYAEPTPDDTLQSTEATSTTTTTPAFTLADTLSDQAQVTTIAFGGLGVMTGNLDSQSFFPPGKVADYTGFQYLRDNDPDNMGHNTSFLTRVANNVIYILNSTQLAQMVTLALAQADQVSLYGYKRFALMEAFRRLVDGNIPSGSTGLSLTAVKAASNALYLIDGQISFDRALLYAKILNSMDSTQKAYLDAMKGKGFNSWPNITGAQINAKMISLPQGTAVAVMTYASDIYSWYAGSVTADVYFCPERHGTYYGSFYMKDAPAVGHEGYSISEQLTATAGAALCDSTKGYVTQSQAAYFSSLVDTQRNNLYAGTSNIVQIRTQISTLLRSLLTSTASADSVKTQVLALSGTYGDLDGENNYNYATVFAQVYASLTTDQKTKLTALRKSILSGKYADGTPFDFSVCTTPFLYSDVITNLGLLTPYIANTDYLFNTGSTTLTAAFTFLPATPAVGQMVQFTDTSTGTPTKWAWNFGDSSATSTSSLQNPSHTYSAAGTFTVSLTASNATSSKTVTKSITVTTTGSGPTAAFTCAPSAPKPGQIVQFKDTSTGKPTTWSWTFGDTSTTSTSTIQNPSHIYSAAGKYSVSLKVGNAVGTSTYSNSITVGIVPVAAFNYSPSAPKTSQTINFSDTSTGNPTSWSWTFGDGMTSSIQKPNHVYSAAGTYTVTLKAGNALGSNSVTKTIIVTGIAPTAVFNYTPRAPVHNQKVQFTDASTGTPTSWSWDFGDKTTGVLPSPGHIYSAAGTFKVTLTVKNAQGTNTTSKTLVVK